MAMKRSAGILLYRVAGDGPEVLLVHPGGPFWAKKDLGAWSIPKGEIDEGEEPRACALRELEEELGSPPPLDPEELIELGSVRQKAKIVEAWAARGRLRPGDAGEPHLLDGVAAALGQRAGVPRGRPGRVVRRRRTARRKILPAQAELIDRLLERLEAAS